ncbi:MAG: hypothetical protein KDA42_00910 [Planctomycetales bacterium]|nr:hypothetical protein [Planctomycetales bacterium]
MNVRYSSLARATTIEEEARGFGRLRQRLLRAAVFGALHNSRLRISVVVLLSLAFWGGLYFLFREGFAFLASYIGQASELYRETVEIIFNIFFASLTIMLVFSAGIIFYGGLYRSWETRMLLTLPVRAERIVLYRFQESLFFSSWGFFLLGSPMLVAYGVVEGSPWLYFMLLAPFVLAFACIPCACGAIACLLIVDRIPRARRYVVAAAVVLVIAGGATIAWSVFGARESDLLTAPWFQDTVHRLSFSEHRLLPSWWLSSGLLEAARTQRLAINDFPLAESVKFLGLLIANAMASVVVLVLIGGASFRRSYSALYCRHSNSRRGRFAWIDHRIMTLIPFATSQVRLLLVKDLRVFRRDPLQWSQFLIFFGLLGLYFVNIRRFTYESHYAAWVNMISFLNLAVVGLILSTFTTRFIFPMISLEGKRFWILGLLPVERDTILWGKFVFASVASLAPCCLLILLSDVMLRISWIVLAVHQFTCVMLCLGLSGIAVGLGARMPNFSERSPSKIAAGFGGTVNLVLSTLYILVEVLLTAPPCHFYVATSRDPLAARFADAAPIEMWIGAGTAAAVLIGLAATFVPMRIGLRAFRTMEF